MDDLSRLSRDRVDSGVLVRELKDLRVSVLDVETGLSSDEDAADMVFGVKALIGGEYIKTIRKQTHRGLEGRALAGFHTGGKAYGYTTVPEPNPADPRNPATCPSSIRTRRGSSVACSRRLWPAPALATSPPS